MSKDDYAREVLRAGRDLSITPRGIVIGFATVSVECDWIMYANRKVPESLTLPHERVGDDGYSVGLFQQQIRKGNNGQWWWADTVTCMDPYKSARLFFERLAKLDYNSTARTPGWYAQAVQKSAYPDRYDQRIGEAQQLYDRIIATTGGPSVPTFDYGITRTMHGYNATSAGIGNSNGPRRLTLFGGVHTQQAKSTAVNLAQYCINSANTGNPVAYNIVVDDRDTIEVVPVNEGPWAAAEANDIAFHLCFAGSFAEWSEGKWLETDSSDGLNEDAMLWRGAKAMAAACLQFGIPAEFAGDGGRAGWPVKPKGIVGHRDFGRRGGGHTDPGNGFPMAEFIRRVQTFINPQEDDIMAALTPDEQRELLENTRWIKAQLGPKDPAWSDESSLGKNSKGQERTLRDGVAAALRAKS